MRLRVEKTEVMYVDLPDEEAEELLPEQRCDTCGEEEYGSPFSRCPNPGCPGRLGARVWHGYLDVCDAVERFDNIAGSQPLAYTEAFVTVEPDDGNMSDHVMVLDGTGPQQRLWRARRIVSDAYGLLQRTRYREGHCPDVDAVSGDLLRIDDRLRVMAIDAERTPEPVSQASSTGQSPSTEEQP